MSFIRSTGFQDAYQFLSGAVLWCLAIAALGGMDVPHESWNLNIPLGMQIALYASVGTLQIVCAFLRCLPCRILSNSMSGVVLALCSFSFALRGHPKLAVIFSIAWLGSLIIIHYANGALKKQKRRVSWT